MRSCVLALSAALLMAPLGARAADLVVWWEKGYYAEEDEAVTEIIEAFEQKTGTQVEVTFYQGLELPDSITAAFEASARPPDLAFGLYLPYHIAEWAFEDRLVDLSDTLGVFSGLFDPDALERGVWPNGKTGENGLYGLPVGRASNHIHVWKSLLESAGFTLSDIPRKWETFWSFWCEEVQPGVRQATGRGDIWGIGFPMSQTFDTEFEFFQFVAAHDADYVTRDGTLVIDDPTIRQKLVEVIQDYTGFYGEGCTPPDSVTWGDIDNNKRFHAQAVVMTANESLSIPNALRRERSDDYFENVVTIDWPLGPSGEPFAIVGEVFPAVVFQGGANVAGAKDFIRFLVRDGWLAHYLNFSGERMLPSMSQLSEQPFWLDPHDPHRMAAAIQVAAHPLAHNYAAASGNRRHDLVDQEDVWAKAIHRIVTEEITPKQAVDEAIARVKQILAE